MVTLKTLKWVRDQDYNRAARQGLKVKAYAGNEIPSAYLLICIVDLGVIGCLYVIHCKVFKASHQF